jgi:16S rRNA (cytosine967-C5)-methyltransferase
VVALLDPQKADAVLDMCAAPGGKSTLLAECVTDEGMVCACDSNPRRGEQIVENCTRMDIRNIFLVCTDCSRPSLQVKFNKVLLDAPCSATGVLHRHPDGRWKKTPEDIDRAVRMQKALLDAAAELVAPGGTLVYATCSLEREENQGQVEAFIKRHSSFSVIRPPHSVPDSFIDLDGYLSITPFEHQMDGIFAVRLKKESR